MTVKKVKGGHKVVSCHGRRHGPLSKKPLSKAKAHAQHRAVQANKKRR